MIEAATLEARAAAAAERRTPGGLTAATERMAAATDGAATTLTEAQLEVLTLLAHGIGTVRDLCAARGFTSTNGVAEHLDRLKLRGLIERVLPSDGRRYRYAPWVLTSAGWRTLGPCACSAAILFDTAQAIDAALEAAMGETTRQGGALGHIAVEAIGAGRRDAVAYLRRTWGVPELRTADGSLVPRAVDPPRPVRFCAWCGWRLW